MRGHILLACLLPIAACAALPSGRTGPAPPQIAHLNHFYATVDAETASAIRNSEFLRRFANVEVRTTSGTQSTWTGTYLYGRQTYAEFFGPGDFQIEGRPAPVGGWGIALSGDRPGHVAELQSRIEAAGGTTVVELDTRLFGERRVPWFTALTAVTAHGDSGGRNEVVTGWAMEYVPSYLDLPEAGREPADGPHDVISRERYQSDLYLQRMMRDVTRVEFDLPRSDYARIEPLLAAAGFRLSRSGDRVLADGEATDFLFHIATGDRRGLRRVEFSLNAPAAPHVEHIKRSRLSLGPGARAEWTFD